MRRWSTLTCLLVAWQKHLKEVRTNLFKAIKWPSYLGAVIGPTFSCIIGTQFQKLMDGDRYFYRHSGGSNIHPLQGDCFFLFLLCLFYLLTGAMLEEVKRRSLSDIICENTDIKELTRNCFVQVINSYSMFIVFIVLILIFLVRRRESQNSLQESQ